MSRSAEVTLAFGGEDRVFCLKLGRLRALQEKTDCGPMALLSRYMSGDWRVDDVREAILQGLIGGGLDQANATKLVMSYFDDQPLQPFVQLAQGVVMAALVGAEDEDLGEPEGEGQPTSPSPMESSDLPGSTAAEPSSDSAPEKSTS